MIYNIIMDTSKGKEGMMNTELIMKHKATPSSLNLLYLYWLLPSALFMLCF